MAIKTYTGGVKRIEEETFEKAYKEMATKMGLSLDPDDPRHFYNWRALYKEDPTLTPNPEGHFPSKHKEKGHPREIVTGINTITGEKVEPKFKPSFQMELTSRQNVILDIMKQGYGNPNQILNFLNYDEQGNKVGDFTLDEVKKLQPKANVLSKNVISIAEELTGMKLKNKNVPYYFTPLDQETIRLTEEKVAPVGEGVHLGATSANTIIIDPTVKGLQGETLDSRLIKELLHIILQQNEVDKKISYAENERIAKEAELYYLGGGKGLAPSFKLLQPLQKKEEMPVLKPLEKIKDERMFAPTIYTGGVKRIEEIPEAEPIYKWEIAPEITETLWDKFKKLFEAKPIEEIAKSQNIYAISQATDKSIEEVSRDYDKMGRILGLRGIPTSEEYMTAIFAFPVTAAIIANPITALGGLGKFMILAEAENFVVSKLKGWQYKFDAGRGLKELLPAETNQLTKDIIDVIDVIGKGIIIGKGDKNVREMWNRFTKQISTEYRMPQTMYLSSKKIMDLHKSNPKLYTQFERDIYAKLGMKAKAARMAFKKGGIDLEIPASKITTITDRPYWAKIKSLFNVKPTSKTVVTMAGEVKPTAVTFLLPGEIKEGIPVVTQPQIVYEKAAEILSIEAPFKKAGAKETGFQVKNYYSNVGLARGQGLQEIDVLNKFKINPVVVRESGFKASGELDYTDITYLTERPGYFVKLTPEERKKVSPIKKSIKDFYKVWEDRFKKIKWMEEPFPQSLITRHQAKISGLKKQLEESKIASERIKIKTEIDKLTSQIERVKRQRIQFVSIPAKAILAKADADPEMQTKLMSILPHWGRKTITVKDLVDANIISRQEADIRYIIGEYADRMGRKYALGKIFVNAEKEGLIKPEAIKPNWSTPRIYIKGQYTEIPQLRGKRLDPFFSDVITNFFSIGPVTMGPVFGTIKMMQFYNPLFMPMYDVWQTAATGTFLNPIKGTVETVKGIRDSIKKNDNYWLAYENGLFSKPYVIPYDKFEYRFTEAMKGNKVGNFVKKAVLPINWLPMLYTTSWHTAWKLDETIRMISFNYLKDKGLTDRNAAQLAALFHSDYASVPPATRRTLNKLFFTPTFKITMSKLYAEMLKGSIKVLTKGKNATQREKILARGALIALAIMMGGKLYLESQGYKEVERFRKYTKTIETDEGMKENVITLSHPFNIPWRYYYRVKNAWNPQNLNVAEKLVEAAKWDLHPIWRVAYDIVENKNFGIYNPFDESGVIAFDLAKYVTGEFVAITRGLLESAETGEISAENFRILQKDMGRLKAIIMKPFIFNYVREPRKVRKVWAIKSLQKAFTSMTYMEASKDSKKNHTWIKNFNERLKKILKMFEEEKEKEYKGGVKRLR